MCGMAATQLRGYAGGPNTCQLRQGTQGKGNNEAVLPDSCRADLRHCRNKRAALGGDTGLAHLEDL